jgi:hypothetical protein
MKHVSIFLLLTALAVLSCSKTKDVTISLTNPQSIAVAYDGHYQVNTDAEEAMTGTTPHDYQFSLKKGDQLIGQLWKSDSSNFTDTLRFQVFVDDVEQTSMTHNIIIPTELGGIQFSLSVQ